MFAVVEAKGKQYKVTPGAKISVDHMAVPEGKTVELDNVLVLGGDDGSVTVGTPTIAGAKVVAESLGEEKGDKIIVFRYRNKVRYRKKTGHRHLYTNLSIKQIVTKKPGRASKSKQG